MTEAFSYILFEDVTLESMDDDWIPKFDVVEWLGGPERFMRRMLTRRAFRRWRGRYRNHATGRKRNV